MVPPVDEVAAGDVAPAEARAVAVVEIHEVVAAVGVERAVGIAGHAHVLRHAEMVSRAIRIGEETLAQQPRGAHRPHRGPTPVNDQVFGMEICFPSSPPEQVVMTVAPLPPRTRQPSSMRTSPISLISVKRPVFSRSPSSANDHQAQGLGAPAIFPGCKAAMVSRLSAWS